MPPRVPRNPIKAKRAADAMNGWVQHSEPAGVIDSHMPTRPRVQCGTHQGVAHVSMCSTAVILSKTRCTLYHCGRGC